MLPIGSAFDFINSYYRSSRHKAPNATSLLADGTNSDKAFITCHSVAAATVAPQVERPKYNF